jgi:hypothetical protein
MAKKKTVKMFERDNEYMGKLFMLGLEGRHVIKDAEIVIVKDTGKGSKARALCARTGTWTQFPNNLRILGKCYKADVVSMQEFDGDMMNAKAKGVFYRAIPGSIRAEDSNEVLG